MTQKKEELFTISRGNKHIRGLMPDELLDELDRKELIQRAKDSPDNSFVAAVDNKIVGFCSYWTETIELSISTNI